MNVTNKTVLVPWLISPQHTFKGVGCCCLSNKISAFPYLQVHFSKASHLGGKYWMHCFIIQEENTVKPKPMCSTDQDVSAIQTCLQRWSSKAENEWTCFPLKNHPFKKVSPRSDKISEWQKDAAENLVVVCVRLWQEAKISLNRGKK